MSFKIILITVNLKSRNLLGFYTEVFMENFEPLKCTTFKSKPVFMEKFEPDLGVPSKLPKLFCIHFGVRICNSVLGILVHQNFVHIVYHENCCQNYGVVKLLHFSIKIKQILDGIMCCS